MSKRFFIILMISLATLAGTSSCGTSHASRKQKETAKLQEQRKKEVRKQYDVAVKRHQSIQTKETRKRIRQNTREAKRKAKGQKQFFLFRWFSQDR